MASGTCCFGAADVTLELRQFSIPLLQPIDLTLADGWLVTLSGPSGAGKSLLLRAMADLDPHQGECLLDGVSQHSLPPPAWRRQVGLLPAEPQWWFDLVGEHFPNDGKRFLQPLGLPAECLQWEVSRLSSGERQRLGLARLLENQPRVLLLDEATANLDQENTERVERLIHQLQESEQLTVLWVSHDPQQRQRLSQRSLRIRQGRLEPDTWI